VKAGARASMLLVWLKKASQKWRGSCRTHRGQHTGRQAGRQTEWQAGRQPHHLQHTGTDASKQADTATLGARTHDHIRHLKHMRVLGGVDVGGCGGAVPPTAVEGRTAPRG